MAVRSLAQSSLVRPQEVNSMLAGYDANYYYHLETVRLGANATSVSFTNLDRYADFEHLQVRFVARGDAGTSYGWQWLQIQLNNSNLTYYHEIRAQNSAVSTSLQAFNYVIPITGANQVAGVFGAGIIDILNANSTVQNKTIRSIGGQTDLSRPVVVFSGGFFQNTNPITNILFSPQNGGSFINGTRFSLYGIRIRS